MNCIAHRSVRSTNHKLPVFLLAAGMSAAALSMGCQDILTFSKESHTQGMEFYQQKDYADAAGAFHNAVRQVPSDYEDHYYLANCYAAMGQWQQAIHAYYDAREIMATDGFGQQDIKLKYEVLDGLANAIANSDTRDSEINAAEEKAKQRQSSEDYVLLAKIFVDRSDPDSAIDAYDRAAMIDPDSFYIAKEYGLYLQRMGQTDKAAIPLRRAYTLNATDPQVNNALRQIGIIPGPALKEQDALAKPLIPRGPIPEVDLGKAMGLGASATPASSTQAPQD